MKGLNQFSDSIFQPCSFLDLPMITFCLTSNFFVTFSATRVTARDTIADFDITITIPCNKSGKIVSIYISWTWSIHDFKVVYTEYAYPSNYSSICVAMIDNVIQRFMVCEEFKLLVQKLMSELLQWENIRYPFSFVRWIILFCLVQTPNFKIQGMRQYPTYPWWFSKELVSLNSILTAVNK